MLVFGYPCTSKIAGHKFWPFRWVICDTLWYTVLHTIYFNQVLKDTCKWILSCITPLFPVKDGIRYISFFDGWVLCHIWLLLSWFILHNFITVLAPLSVCVCMHTSPLPSQSLWVQLVVHAPYVYYPYNWELVHPLCTIGFKWVVLHSACEGDLWYQSSEWLSNWIAFTKLLTSQQVGRTSKPNYLWGGIYGSNYVERLKYY